eukprot:g31966.t1
MLSEFSVILESFNSANILPFRLSDMKLCDLLMRFLQELCRGDDIGGKSASTDWSGPSSADSRGPSSVDTWQQHWRRVWVHSGICVQQRFMEAAAE